MSELIAVNTSHTRLSSIPVIGSRIADLAGRIGRAGGVIKGTFCEKAAKARGLCKLVVPDTAWQEGILMVGLPLGPLSAFVVRWRAVWLPSASEVSVPGVVATLCSLGVFGAISTVTMLSYLIAKLVQRNDAGRLEVEASVHEGAVVNENNAAGVLENNDDEVLENDAGIRRVEDMQRENDARIRRVKAGIRENGARLRRLAADIRGFAHSGRCVVRYPS